MAHGKVLSKRMKNTNPVATLPKPVTSRTVSPARLFAAEILRRVEDQRSYAAVLLAEKEPELRQDDRALCYVLVLGVLRWQLWLDTLIERFSGRKVETLDLPVRIALRLGLYQLRFLSRVPASAAVNESVNLAYVGRVKSAAGFINAVLRRSLKEPTFDPVSVAKDPLGQLAIATSHPLWLIERWVEQFGMDETRAFAASNNLAPPVSFRISLGVSEEKILAQLNQGGAKVTPSMITPGAWRVDGGAPTLRKMAGAGTIYVQDESSQLVAHLLQAMPGDRIFDACAAPGSKTTLIGSLTGDRASIFAGDIHAHRLEQVKVAAKSQQLRNISCIALDSAKPPFGAEVFDRVLVDAPCSGTGTLRRNPEIRWRITKDSIASASEQQFEILHGAAKTLKVGGRLIYSTCSVEMDENERVVERFLSANGNFSAVLPTNSNQTGSKTTHLRLWPHTDGADGFFASALVRRD
jgi:16S rRNA (cytosine967-C5)-methyltransferase